MDHSIIRNSEAKELATYLRKVAGSTTSQSVTDELLTAISSESVPPGAFTVWLSASGDPGPLRQAVQQDHSRSIRTAGIRRFGKWFRTSRLTEAWQVLGETAGVLHVLSRLSVYDVKQFCSEIGRSGTIKVQQDLRQRYADQLFKALCYQHFPETDLKTSDPRPLVLHYQDILSACSPDLVVRHLEAEVTAPTTKSTRRLLQAYSSVLRDKYLSVVTGETGRWKSIGDCSLLLWNIPSDTPSNQNSRLSTSMVFSINLLQELTGERNLSKLDSRAFDRALVTPLLRKLCRRRCEPQLFRDVVDLVVSYARRYLLGGTNPITLTRGGAVWSLVSRWVQSAPQLESSLVDLLGTLNMSVPTRVEHLVPLIRSVPLRLRWELLMLLLKHIPQYATDISSDDELRLTKWQWPVSLLLVLSATEARRLLERLIRLKPESRFMEWYTSPKWATSFPILTGQHLPLHHREDPTCLLIMLSRGDGNGLENAVLAVEERKKEATRAREQPERAFWAGCALDCAVASGSLHLYQKTLFWARRYNKDHETARELYSRKRLHTREGLDLLCGLPEKPETSSIIGKDALCNVSLSNRILRELFDSACVALREPNFYQAHWTAVLHLLAAVCRLRLSRVNDLQDALALSDEEVHNLIWKDTLETCLSLEEAGLEDDKQSLKFNTIGGPLWNHEAEFRIDGKSRPSTLAFVDELAKRRNHMWEAHRRRTYPATLTLPLPFPRGLPLQCLYSLDMSSVRKGLMLPYLNQRAEAVVFANPNIVLLPPPEDEECQTALGSLVDEYTAALKLYVVAYPLREQQALAAWKHATGQLSRPRLSAAEAFVFWQPIFTNALEKAEVSGPWVYSYLDKLRDAELPLPEDDSHGDRIEWNPDPEAALYEVKQRKLETTNLDLMLDNRYTPYCDIKTKRIQIETRVMGTTAQPLWERYEKKRIPARTIEALTVAAILHVNEKRGGLRRLLATPFPPTGQARFPALLLDDEFLDRKSLENIDSAVAMLRRVGRSLPPTLLLQLVKSIFTALEADDKSSNLTHDAFTLLKLMSQGDRPELALDMITAVVLDRPGDSSWHRSLLTTTLLESLPPDKAKRFMESITDAIQSRLRIKPSASTSTPAQDGEKKASHAPFVKVTTSKMLAQLTSGAEYIDELFTIRILEDLISSACHLDIRVAVVESLIDMLGNSTDREVKDAIFAVLSRYAIPAAASMNERQPMTEEDWLKAESSPETVPEVYTDGSPASLAVSLPPILAALMAASIRFQLVDEDRDGIIQRLLLPTLQASAQANQRWMRIFLKHLHVQPIDLPAYPVKVSFLGQMFRHAEHLPSSALKSWIDMLAIDICPPQAVAHVNTLVREDAKLRGSNAGRHWLSLWQAGKPMFSNVNMTPMSLLTREWQSKVADGIDHARVQTLILWWADLLLHNADETFADWNNFLGGLQLPFNDRQKAVAWQRHCRPVLQAIIERIDTLRTPGWQQDPHRWPRVLPSSHTLRLWLLTWPHLPWSAHDADLARLGGDICGVIEQIGASSVVNGARYNELEAAILRISGLPAADLQQLALTLGDARRLQARDEVKIADMLRVSLAGAIVLNIVRPKRSDLAAEPRDMVVAWTECAVEEIRMEGFKVARALQSAQE